MNKFSTYTKPHDAITVDYYTSVLPTCIVQFFKQTMKPTLLENFEEAIAVETDLHAIGVINNDEPIKDSNDASRKPQAAASKCEYKEASDIEMVTFLVKNLTTKMPELKNKRSRHPLAANLQDKRRRSCHQEATATRLKLHRAPTQCSTWTCSRTPSSSHSIKIITQKGLVHNGNELRN